MQIEKQSVPVSLRSRATLNISSISQPEILDSLVELLGPGKDALASPKPSSAFLEGDP